MSTKQQQKNDVIVLSPILFVLFYSSFCTAMPFESIAYRINHASIPHENCLLIEGAFKENDTKELLIRIPSSIKKIDFFSQGNKIPFEKRVNSELVKIPTTTKQDIQFKYAYCVKNPTRNLNFPIIEKDFTHLIVNHFLITPEYNNKKTVIDMSLEGFSQDDKVVTSFNMGQKRYQIQEKIEDFRNSVICLGKITIDNLKIKNNTITVVSNGKWPYLDTTFYRYMKEIFKAQRRFWQDHQFAHYVIFFIKQNEPMIPRIFVGRHWHNALSCLLPEDPQAQAKVLYGLSHEANHAWLGGKMKIPLPQGNLQWFFEGFNDFYGLLFAYQSGSITLKDYLEIYNELIMDYLSSPLINVTNEEINKHFILGNPFNQIAQVRSHLVAKQLRDKFNHLSPNTVDLAMQALFQQYQALDEKFVSEEAIDNIFNEQVAFDLWESTKEVLLNGKLIAFSPMAFAPFATMSVVDKVVPDFGFNVKYMLENATITNVIEHSPAFIAGLRDGQRVKIYDINFKSLEKIFMQVEEKGIEKTIIFIPDSLTKKFPQYVLTSILPESGLRNRKNAC